MDPKEALKIAATYLMEQEHVPSDELYLDEDESRDAQTSLEQEVDSAKLGLDGLRERLEQWKEMLMSSPIDAQFQLAFALLITSLDEWDQTEAVRLDIEFFLDGVRRRRTYLVGGQTIERDMSDENDPSTGEDPAN